MKFACTQENLAQGLSLVGHVTGKNANLPILSNVLLKTEDGSLKLFATNLEMAASVAVRGRVEMPGEFTVPAKLLQDYVSLLPSGKVEFVVKGDALEIEAGGQVTSMKGMPASEFPLIPKLAKENGYRISAPVLAQAISQVVFAVSVSESRPELSGVACYFHGSAGQDRFVMAATDSYRLAERALPLAANSSSLEAKCIVPARAMAEVARILSAYKDDVGTPEEAEWALTESQFIFTYGNVELVSRLIEGSFPDYRQILPNTHRSLLTLSRQELAKAIRAASLFARQGLFDVHLEVVEGGEIKVSSSDTGKGAHTTTLKGELEGDANKVTVNYRYLSDGLSVMGKDKVVMKLIDGMSPVLVSAVDDADFRYLVMPIRQ
jgi:DNA polymerase III subunit beta